MRSKIRKLLDSCSKIPFTLLVVFATAIVGSQAIAATYYVSPSGSDSNAGTSTAPWRTFSFATPKLRPGDTLILRNGTYGPLELNCAAGQLNGQAGQPITIKAENERQALIYSNGFDALRLYDCSYWIFEGIHFRSNDTVTGNSSQGWAVTVLGGGNHIFRRNIMSHPNRNYNTHALDLYKTSGNLVEENEIYNFHRHGIIVGATNGQNSIRRNYVNGRGAYVPGVWYGDGSCGISIYPASNQIIENNIVENVVLCFGELNAINGYGAANNRHLGNISIGYGPSVKSRGTIAADMPQNNLIENMVVINTSKIFPDGMDFLATKNSQLKNSSFFLSGATRAVAATDNTTESGDRVYSFSAENVYATGASTVFYTNVSIGTITATADYTASYNVPTVATAGTVTNIKTATTNEFGSCRVFVPASAITLKGQGKNGEDIGANVLYRYENGVLTNKPLWNPTTGEFPGGAIIQGVNDISGSSRFDVHKRLNVNVNGCSFPEGYGGTVSASQSQSSSTSAPSIVRPSSPVNLTVGR
jgi:Right handed beta helix region